MSEIILVGAGGFIGTVLRYLMYRLPFKTESGFPFPTLVINIIGAFMIGFITAEALKFGGGNTKLMLFLRTGICGGFTTFSTFSLEAAELFRGGETAAGLIYISVSIMGCLAAIWIAQSLVCE